MIGGGIYSYFLLFNKLPQWDNRTYHNGNERSLSTKTCTKWTSAPHFIHMLGMLIITAFFCIFTGGARDSSKRSVFSGEHWTIWASECAVSFWCPQAYSDLNCFKLREPVSVRDLSCRATTCHRNNCQWPSLHLHYSTFSGSSRLNGGHNSSDMWLV